MKITERTVFAFVAAALVVALAGSAFVEAEGEDDTAPLPDSSQIQKFSTEELHTLVAPIALYPDALLAQILPACAYPLQIIEASRFVQSNPNVDNPPANTSWDPSVIALLHYPTVLKKLNDDPTWTEQLGVAATYQMEDTMRAIQQVRSEAQTVGNLQSNDKQLVQVNQGAIEIVPADPQYIYVPEYDPVYICDRRLADPFIWGPSWGFGIWLGNRWDWRDHHLWYGTSWRGGHWYNGAPTYWRPPYRPIPSWYTRNGARGPGFSSWNRSSNSSSIRNDRVRPIASTHLDRPGTPSTRPQIPQVHSNIGGEDFSNRGHQSLIESNRGRLSREQPPARDTINRQPVVREPVVRQPVVREPVVREPVVREPIVRQPIVREPAPQRQPLHEEFSHQPDRGTVNRESNRGSMSRGGGGGGGGGGGRPGGKR